MKKIVVVFLMMAIAAVMVSADNPCLDYLYIQGDAVNVREEPDTKAPVIMKLNKTDSCDVLEKGKGETIGGKNDFWYKIKNSGKTGWVFGAFTSLKQEGRKTVTMTFTGCGFGDVEHHDFKDAQGKVWDFYGVGHNYCGYRLCEGGPGDDMPSAGSKKYINKKFEMVLNTILVVTCENWPDCTKHGFQKKTVIVSMELVK